MNTGLTFSSPLGGLPVGRRSRPLTSALGLWLDTVPARTSLEGLFIPLLPAQNILSGAPLERDQACDPG